MESENQFPETTPIEFILQLNEALSTLLSKYPPLGRAGLFIESLYPGGFKYFSIAKVQYLQIKRTILLILLIQYLFLSNLLRCPLLMRLLQVEECLY